MTNQWKSASEEYYELMYLVNNNHMGYEDDGILDRLDLLEFEIISLLALMED